MGASDGRTGDGHVSWEEEWAELKAEALVRLRDPARMRLNQAAADPGGGATGPDGRGGGYAVNADSIDGSSHVLLEIAGVLYEGRMDGENATTCRVPRSHHEVSAQLVTFARHAQDQYNDAVVLLAALSSKLTSAGNAYTQYDEAVRAQLDSVLVSGRYTAPGDR
ncbi:hypothetical protein HGA06_03455 [Streptomyces somaliensis DSM 40738]|uniref:Uncharacterized protein n=1 Tax=Streptomyces somaliensis (strain ATCC 33201 / DSM 40738 / JCM 12659 / KCTC 9044 / NCTC 11332 / NRRL B-12077 / IP 733) TaxID=1134445 RepID=A0AA44DAM1_STRE0|nr:hypothetical protein [Streptomyces somaliensis DSM 40738]